MASYKQGCLHVYRSRSGKFLPQGHHVLIKQTSVHSYTHAPADASEKMRPLTFSLLPRRLSRQTGRLANVSARLLCQECEISLSPSPQDVTRLNTLSSQKTTPVPTTCNWRVARRFRRGVQL